MNDRVTDTTVGAIVIALIFIANYLGHIAQALEKLAAK